MKRLTAFAFTAGLAWAGAVFADPDVDAHASARRAVLDALAERASLPPEMPSMPHAAQHGALHERDSIEQQEKAAHAAAGKHADTNGQDALRTAHERAMSHASTDGNASHVDAANRAAMHSINGTRTEADVQSHDAASQMRTRMEHGDTRGMGGEGGDGGEGRGGEGGGSGMLRATGGK